MYLHSLALSTEWWNSSDTPVLMAHPTSRPWSLNTIPQYKDPGLLGERADSRDWTGKK